MIKHIVRLQGISDGILSVSSLDVIDGTPLIDIKPHIPQFDSPNAVTVRWFEKPFRKKKPTIIADHRFLERKAEG